MTRKKIVVYCGSRKGNDPAYAAFAGRLGEAIGRGGYDLFYGGGGIGLMGILADAALACGAETTGIMPRFLIEKEQAHLGLTHLIPVDTINERKEQLIAAGDAFVILPGGVGTMEELFDTLSSVHLSGSPLTQAPVLVADVSGLYSPLALLWDNFLKAGFLPAAEQPILRVCRTIEEIVSFWPPSKSQ